MSDREDILQGVRAALKLAFTLTDSQVIAKDAGSIRVATPYVTVKVTTSDTLTGVTVDWTIHGDNGGVPTKAARGPRSAVVELDAFGRTATEWLEVFPDHVQSNPAVIASLKASGIVILNFGAAVDVAALLDTEIEARVIRTLGISYEHLGEAFDVVEFDHALLDLTLESPTGPGSVTLGTVLDPDDPFC